MVICTCGSRVGKYLHDGGKTFEPSTNGVPGKLLTLHKSSSLFRQAKLQSSYIKKACLYILHTLCSITYIINKHMSLILIAYGLPSILVALVESHGTDEFSNQGNMCSIY